MSHSCAAHDQRKRWCSWNAFATSIIFYVYVMDHEILSNRQDTIILVILVILQL